MSADVDHVHGREVSTDDRYHLREFVAHYVNVDTHAEHVLDYMTSRDAPPDDGDLAPVPRS